ERADRESGAGGRHAQRRPVQPPVVPGQAGLSHALRHQGFRPPLDPCMTTPAVHVITILSLPQSMEASARCLASAAAHGLEARIFPAFTPVDDPVAIFRNKGWPTTKFTHNRYSRPLPCMACFASHAELWRICVAANRHMIV